MQKLLSVLSRTLGMISVLSLTFLCRFALAGDLHSPVGLWETIDDETGKVKSHVRIYAENGVLTGKIEALLNRKPGDENPLCTACEGARKDQPMLGMQVIWGMTADGDEFSGGRILDPAKGSEYKCSFKVIEEGKRLKVRGYIGFSLFGRSQTWNRIE